MNRCLFCVWSKSGNRIPRPLARRSTPHFEYLFLGTSETGDTYALVIKDDLSGYSWLCPTKSANAEHTSAMLPRCLRTFSAPKYWFSDQGSHFINELMRIMATYFNIVHKPTVAYSPCANGTVERLNRDVLSALRAILAELDLGPQDWPTVT